MTAADMLNAVQAVFLAMWIAYGLGVMFGRRASLSITNKGFFRLMRLWTFRLRWITWFGVHASLFVQGVLLAQPVWLTGISAICTWYWVRADRHDDDFWKRLKGRAKEAVAVAGHKLVIVPTNT